MWGYIWGCVYKFGCWCQETIISWGYQVLNYRDYHRDVIDSHLVSVCSWYLVSGVCEGIYGGVCTDLVVDVGRQLFHEGIEYWIMIIKGMSLTPFWCQFVAGILCLGYVRVFMGVCVWVWLLLMSGDNYFMSVSSIELSWLSQRCHWLSFGVTL